MAQDELFPMASEQSEPIDIKRLLLRYARYWYIFIISVAIALAAAFLYLRYYAVPIYSVYGTLLIKDDKSGQALSNADALNDLSAFKTSRNIDNETEVIKSKSLMTRVVKELDLVASYYIEGKVKNRELYGSALPIKLLPNKVDSSAAGIVFSVLLKSGSTFDLDDNSGKIITYHFGQQINKPYGSFTIIGDASKNIAGSKVIIQFQNNNQLADYYNRAISVLPINKNASILYISLSDPIPERAKNVINKLMDVYNREAIEDKNLMAKNTLKFLDNRLQYILNDLSKVETTVENYKSTNGLTDISAQAAAYTAQASTYNSQLTDWAIQIEILESIENYLGKSNNRYAMVPSTLGIKDETLVGLLKNFNELQLERTRMLRTTEQSNVLVQNIDSQLSNLRVNILENLRNIKRSLQITSNNLKSSSGQFQSKIRQVPGMEKQLTEISRQQIIKQNIYSYLLQKREETAISLAATSSVARVIDPAMGGNYPISPNGMSIYLMAFLLGVGVPFAGIYAIRLINNKVQVQQDVTSVTPTPILGEIAHNTSRDSVVVTPGNRSPIAEMFRLVRANLNFATVGKEKLVILTTSSMSGEGKTFFSINLGASIALTGKKTIFIDLDLRNPKVASKLELPKGLGITDYLMSKDVSINDIIRVSDKVPGLCIISSGPIPPNPAELIMSAKLTNLINELKSSFDYVILDTPPVGQVADAFTLSHVTDFTVFVVRYNYTKINQLTIIKNIYKNKILNYPMIVLNDAKESNESGYGYGYGYGYEQQGIQGKNKKLSNRTDE